MGGWPAPRGPATLPKPQFPTCRAGAGPPPRGYGVGHPLPGKEPYGQPMLSLTGREPLQGAGQRPASDGPVLTSARPEGRNRSRLRSQALALSCRRLSKSPFRPRGGGGSSAPGAGLTPKHKERLSTRLPGPRLDLPAALPESLPLK